MAQKKGTVTIIALVTFVALCANAASNVRDKFPHQASPVTGIEFADGDFEKGNVGEYPADFAGTGLDIEIATTNACWPGKQSAQLTLHPDVTGFHPLAHEIEIEPGDKVAFSFRVRTKTPDLDVFAQLQRSDGGDLRSWSGLIASTQKWNLITATLSIPETETEKRGQTTVSLRPCIGFGKIAEDTTIWIEDMRIALMKKTIMAVFAHADDVELRAGGALAKYLKDGYDGVYIITTACNSGYNRIGGGAHYSYSETISEIRDQEVKDAAAVFGLQGIRLNYREMRYTTEDGESRFLDVVGQEIDPPPSGRIPIVTASTMPENMEEMKDLILKYRPAVILTHGIENNPDHYCTMLLTHQGFARAIKERRVLGKLYASVRHDVGTEVIMTAQPDLVVDVTDTLDTALEALRKHESQFTERYVVGIKRQRARMGQEHHCRYAEGFFLLLDAWPKETD